MKKLNKKRVGSEAQYGPRTLGEILHDYLENSNEPLARAYREHVANEKKDETNLLFETIFPCTELDVDLKLLMLRPGRMRKGEFLAGMLTRDGENHYSFVQKASEKKVTTMRNPRIYKGSCINVNQNEDGTLRPTFNRPKYTKDFSFRSFCHAAAKELLLVADLLEEEEG